ncbi:MAG: SNF2-related protein [Armatimonadota bacterium]
MSDLNLDLFFKYASSSIIQRGISYFHQGRADIFSVDENLAVIHVSGSMIKPYNVEMSFDKQAKPYPFSITCTCPHAKDMPMMICKHKVAALLALREYRTSNTSINWRSVLKSVTINDSSSAFADNGEVLFFSLQRQYGRWYMVPYSLPASYFDITSLSDITETHAVIESMGLCSLAKAIRDRKNITRYVNATSLHLTALNLVLDCEKYGFLLGRTLDTCLPLLAGCHLYRGDTANPLKMPLTVVRESARLEVDLQRTESGINMTGILIFGESEVPVRPGFIFPVCSKPTWLITDTMIFQAESSSLLDSLMQGDIVIAERDEEDFLIHYLPDLAEKFNVRGNVFTGWQEVNAYPVPRIYILEESDTLALELRFAYGDYETAFDDRFPSVTIKNADDGNMLARINRNTDVERLVSKSLSGNYGLKKGLQNGVFNLRQTTSPLDFIHHHIPQLMEDGFEVYGEEDLVKYKVNRNYPKISMAVSSGIDWFDVNVDISFGDTHVALTEFRRAFKKKLNYIKLSDGSTGKIPDEWFERYRHIFGLSEVIDGGLRVASPHITLIDSILEEVDRVSVDADFEDRRSRLKDFTGISNRSLPEGFVGNLRAYQKAGFEWLHFLHDYGFGGCLADDMGVGKTVQALVFLQSLRESGHAQTADLLVMPKSLLDNWEREAHRFTPNLRVHIHTGLSRSTDVADFDKYDLVLTTYGIMRRDLELLREYKFHYVILDESQAIKNPVSITGKAARCLNCSHRLALTGTPVENTINDLWSQFAFLNPGLLGTQDYFRKEFAGIIEREGNTDAVRSLHSMVHPFILRRTKEQVAPELPPRIERIVYCDMEGSQLKIYNQWRDRYRSMLLGELKDESIQNIRMKILEGLLRLRQICIHPALVVDDYKGSSAKMDILMETLDTLHSEGHKALIFSQFTSVLKIVQKELVKHKMPHVYLDGQTMNRQDQVDKFQSDSSTRFFLISLKAGGVGLNLTAADYVIHLDPWWNPAVERQASDRTHRIGQDKPVFIHKLIAKGSVEEKILMLQDSKRELADKVITTESRLVKSLTADDIRVLFS